MDDMDEKLNAILSNPQMMQSIMSMAQSLSAPESGKKEDRSPPSLPALGDPELLQKVMGIAKRSGIDADQQNLLKALTPYLSRDRLTKLEKAMRAAKLAGAASTMLGTGGISLFTGR